MYLGDLCSVYTLRRLSLPSPRSVGGLRVTVPIRITGGIFMTTDASALPQGIPSLLVWKSPGNQEYFQSFSIDSKV